MSERPIEIIGGGLAGLSLGRALRRSGINVTVFEAGAYPRHRVCGEFIAGLTQETIEALDLAPLLADALRHREVAWFIPGEAPRVHQLPTAAYGISRYALDARLADAFVAAGGVLHPETRVTDLAARPGRVFAIGRRRGAAKWLGLKLHVRGVPLARDLELHLGREAYVGLSRVEDGWINACGLFRIRRPLAGAEASHPTRDIAAAGEAPGRWNARAPAVFFEYLAACGLDALASRLAPAEFDPASFCAVAGLQFDARVPAAHRIQIGDACAMIPPFTGNGMAMAFQSAAVAAGPLRRYGAGDITWAEACRLTNRALRRQFRVRLASADLLHPFLLQRNRQRGLRVLSRARMLPFRTLYGLLH